MVFQSFNLFAHKTILENVTLGPIKVRREKPAAARERAWICWTGSASPTRPTSIRPSSPAASSSGPRSPGRWRCSRRRCCSTSRRSALDPEMVGEVLDVMTALAREGMTMVVVTHEMGFARHAANRVVFMADGQLVEEAPPAEFFANPRTERAKDFLSKISPTEATDATPRRTRAVIDTQGDRRCASLAGARSRRSSPWRSACRGAAAATMPARTPPPAKALRGRYHDGEAEQGPEDRRRHQVRPAGLRHEGAGAASRRGSTSRSRRSSRRNWASPRTRSSGRDPVDRSARRSSRRARSTSSSRPTRSTTSASSASASPGRTTSPGRTSWSSKDDTSITGPDSSGTAPRRSARSPARRRPRRSRSTSRTTPRSSCSFDSYASALDAAQARAGGRGHHRQRDPPRLHRQGRRPVQVAGETFTKEPYGIGVKKDDTDVPGLHQRRLEKTFADGSYAKAWADTAGKFGPEPARAPDGQPLLSLSRLDLGAVATDGPASWSIVRRSTGSTCSRVVSGHPPDLPARRRRRPADRHRRRRAADLAGAAAAGAGGRPT